VQPQDINLGTNGSVLVTDRLAGAVQHITATGTVENLLDLSSDPLLPVMRVAGSPSGVLYVTVESAQGGQGPFARVRPGVT
jgi:hypothetical protein